MKGMLEEIRDNLVKTIANKQKYLAGMKDPNYLPEGAAMAVIATKQFLEINIDELSKILADIELCLNSDPEK